jgi:hypothetical protein
MPSHIPHKIDDTGEELKRCGHCKEWLPLGEYGKSTPQKDGLKSSCKRCISAAAKGYTSDKQKRKEACSRWRQRHPEKVREVYRNWYADNIEHMREYKRNRYADDVRLAIYTRLSTKIYRSLKDEKKGRSWESLVGYSVDDLIKRLKKTIPAGYTWDDLHKLDIDHIIPRVCFNFSTVDDIDFKRCWELKNLRLLPRRENQSKNDTILYPFQPSLTLAVSNG